MIKCLNCSIHFIIFSVDFLIKLEQNLREFCLKLHASASYLNNLADDASFSIQLHTSELSNFEFNENPVFEVRVF